jgi:hypothetical protein
LSWFGTKPDGFGISLDGTGTKLSQFETKPVGFNVTSAGFETKLSLFEAKPVVFNIGLSLFETKVDGLNVSLNGFVITWAVFGLSNGQSAKKESVQKSV